MKKHEALRLNPGQELRVQHGNNRPLAQEKRIKVAEVKWRQLSWHGGKVFAAKIPMRSTDAKNTAAQADWVSVISTDGEDFGSNELVHIVEET